jgi:hypothetical protein
MIINLLELLVSRPLSPRSTIVRSRAFAVNPILPPHRGAAINNDLFLTELFETTLQRMLGNSVSRAILLRLVVSRQFLKQKYKTAWFSVRSTG